MPSAGDGWPPVKDPAARWGDIQWVSERERFAAIATGLRVVPGASGRVQVQILEFGDGGSVRVASVVPGDRRHMALYRTLITPESEWATDEHQGEDNGGDA